MLSVQRYGYVARCMRECLTLSFLRVVLYFVWFFLLVLCLLRICCKRLSTRLFGIAYSCAESKINRGKNYSTFHKRWPIHRDKLPRNRRLFWHAFLKLRLTSFQTSDEIYEKPWKASFSYIVTSAGSRPWDEGGGGGGVSVIQTLR